MNPGHLQEKDYDETPLERLFFYRFYNNDTPTGVWSYTLGAPVNTRVMKWTVGQYPLNPDLVETHDDMYYGRRVAIFQKKKLFLAEKTRKLKKGNKLLKAEVKH